MTRRQLSSGSDGMDYITRVAGAVASGRGRSAICQFVLLIAVTWEHVGKRFSPVRGVVAITANHYALVW